MRKTQSFRWGWKSGVLNVLGGIFRHNLVSTKTGVSSGQRGQLRTGSRPMGVGTIDVLTRGFISMPVSQGNVQAA